MNWNKAKLHPDLVQYLSNASIQQPTSIQYQVISHKRNIKDKEATVLISATGSGKTIAYLLPLICDHYQQVYNDIKQQKQIKNKVEAIIITPTHETAVQVHNECQRIFNDIYKYDQLTSVFSGQMSLDKQLRILYKTTPYIAICTPGRLLDMLQHQFDSFISVKSLVIDECDRIIDQQQDLIKVMRFIKDSEKIQLQNVTLASATLNLDKLLVEEKESKKQKLQKVNNTIANIKSCNLTPLQQNTILQYFQQLKLNNFKITIFNTYEKQQQLNNLNQSIQTIYYYTESTTEKQHILSYILYMYKTTTLVFLKTSQEVKQFTEIFQSIGYKTVSLTAQQDQGARLNIIEQLKQDTQDTIIFATDLASRGLDINTIKLVIQFYPPQNVATFVHRAGRCCRQEGKENQILGINFCLISPEDAGKYQLVDRVCFQGEQKPQEFTSINYNLFQRLQQILAIASNYIRLNSILREDLDRLYRLQVTSIAEFLHIINDKNLRKENKLATFYTKIDGEVDQEDIEFIIQNERNEVLQAASQLRVVTFNEGRQLEKMQGSEQSLGIIKVQKRQLVPLKVPDSIKQQRWSLQSIVINNNDDIDDNINNNNTKSNNSDKNNKNSKERQAKQNPFKKQQNEQQDIQQSYQVIEQNKIIDLNELLAQSKENIDLTEKREKGLRNIQHKMNRFYQEQIKQKQNEIKQSGMQQSQYQKLVKELKKDYDFEYDKYGKKEFHVGKKNDKKQ